MATFHYKKLIIIIPFCFLAICKGQTEDFETGVYKNRLILTAGSGAGSIVKTAIRSVSSYIDLKIKVSPPLFVKAEYMVHKNIGLGLHFAYQASSFSFKLNDTVFIGSIANLTNVDVDYVTWSVLPRINAHLSPGKPLDFYLGFGIGYRHNAFKFNSNNLNTKLEIPFLNDLVNSNVPKVNIGTMGLDATMGLRYFFNKNIGINAEIGLAKTFAQLGVHVAI